MLEITHLDTTGPPVFAFFLPKTNFFPTMLYPWNSLQTGSNAMREAFTSAARARDEDALGTKTIQNPAHK